MKETILQNLSAECPWRDTLYWYEAIDSTNTRAKQMAREGAPHGTVLVAGHQTGGRGRMGRTFQSPAGEGMYLSVILRPGCTPDRLMHLTCAAGVAACDAVEQVCGIRPQVKWINDLVLGNRKLGGILAEMSFDQGVVDYAVIGIGLNCLQTAFPEPIADIATSLTLHTGKSISPALMAGAMIDALWRMSQNLLTEKEAIMARYKENCITLGKSVQVLREDRVLPAKALDLDSDGGLLVEYPDGRRQVVSSGEVSVRGLYGYV